MSDYYGEPGGTLYFHVKWKALKGVPTAVTGTLTLTRPDGTQVSVTPDPVTITSKTTLGVVEWYVEFDAQYTTPASNAQAAGKWYYRWQSAGDLAAEKEGSFVLRASHVLTS